MKKQIAKIKLQIKACEATPSPPIGPMLGSKGINIMKFCTEFNDRTKNLFGLKKGTIITVVINVYSDKSFDFKLKSAITSVLIKNILNIEKGSALPNKTKIAKITYDQIKCIVEQKWDLFINSEISAIKTICGTVKSMGIEIEEPKI
ncbi:MAG TPA: 50S ribosomal protein L11 [Candidatus Azoamicus sp. OHIO2]